MSDNHGLTVRMNVPHDSKELKRVLDTLNIIGEVQEEKDGPVLIIKAETLDEIRQTVDDVLVALGDL
ncbi:MAG: hypothetical protein CMB77_06555 [Euryarchaeota archaeon]|nr:hypothetical protein [Euryarchaeota archaeon]